MHKQVPSDSFIQRHLDKEALKADLQKEINERLGPIRNESQVLRAENERLKNK
jgi:hypothetical protein